MKTTARQLTTGALIAALYAALTLAFQPLSYGLAQLRISEAITVLPFFLPGPAVPGLTVGCLVANLIAGNGIYDVVFGTLATLIAAVATSKIKNRFLAPAPAVIANALIVGPMLYFVLVVPQAMSIPLYLVMLQVGLGELAACYGLGLPLLLLLNKNRNRLPFLNNTGRH